MDYLYYCLVVLLAIFISFYINKKNNTKISAYHKNSSESEKQEDIFEEESEELEFEEKENIPQNTFSKYKLDIACYWITQKVKPNKNIDYEKLKETILKVFGKLPEILEDNTTSINTDSESFINEVIGRIEHSSTIKYLLVTKSRKITSLLKNILLIIGVIFFVKYQIAIRQNETNNNDFIYLIFAILSFIFSSICKKISERIFNYMLCKMKPGDYLKILRSPDEIIEKKVKINQLSRNETSFNKTIIHQSRNQIICENFLKKSDLLENTINNKVCLYIILDFLRTKYSEEAYSEYLLDKEIIVLEFINAFNPRAVSVYYELSLRYLESERFDDFYNCLLKCRNNNGYDWIIEAEIMSYELFKETCGKI